MDGSDGYQYIFVVGGGANKGTAVCKQFEMDYVGTVTSAIKRKFRNRKKNPMGIENVKFPRHDIQILNLMAKKTLDFKSLG